MTSDYYQYSSMLQKAPAPRCVCFYNGLDEQPEQQELRLSDAFGGTSDIEVKVTMLNINLGKNKELMTACKPLAEYAWLVETVRRYQKEKKDMETAVDLAIDEMPDDFILKATLVAFRAEMKNMFLTEYNQEKVMEKERKEAVDETNRRVAADMLKEKMPLYLIKKISKLSEDTINDIAKTIGIAVL